jgi:hypothetical protein
MRTRDGIGVEIRDSSWGAFGLKIKAHRERVVVDEGVGANFGNSHGSGGRDRDREITQALVQHAI